MWKRCAVAACGIALSGCFSSNVLLTVRADGAGTIEHTATVRPAALERAARPQAPASPSQAPPDTDIFLASLSRRGGRLVVGTPVNITHSPGYDNQPSFTPDGRAVLFASARDAAARPPVQVGGTATPGTDIYRYDIDSGATTRVTDTPESEYSPTVTPDGQHISVIRVEADGTQRLWRFGLDGHNPELVLRDVKPVGYHAWLEANTLALFVLGEPATLQIADARSGQATIVARGIGRSVLRTPSGTLSFVRVERPPQGAATYTIEEITPATLTASVLTRPVAGSGDPNLAWMRDGTLLMAHDGVLYSWRRGDREWTRAADLAALGLKSVTRLAVSARGDRIAIVAVAGGDAR